MAKAKKIEPKLNIQHHYITLKLPVGNFTTSFSGAKASGQLATMSKAFTALDNYVQTASKTKTVGEAMNDLLNPALLDKLVPGWDSPVVAETFVPGDKVSLKSDLLSKKYPGQYEVKMTKGKYTYITVTNKSGVKELIGFYSTEFTKK